MNSTVPTPTGFVAWLAALSVRELFTFGLRHGSVVLGTIAGVGFVTKPYASSYVQGEAKMYVEGEAYGKVLDTKLAAKNYVTVAQLADIVKLTEEYKRTIDKLDDQVDTLRMNDRSNAELLKKLDEKSDSQQDFNNRLFDYMARNGNAYQPQPSPAYVAPPISAGQGASPPVQVPGSDVTGQILNAAPMPGLSLDNPFKLQ